MKILVTSRSFGSCDTKSIQMLEQEGFTVEIANMDIVTPEKIASKIQGVDCLIVGNDRVNETVFKAADRLKLVHMHGTGLDGIDLVSASKYHVLVSNVVGANKNAVAEMTLALMMNISRRIDLHINILKNGGWSRTPGHEISHKTIGIIGLGNIGRRLVTLLTGFTPKIIGYDVSPDLDWAQNHGVFLAQDIDEVFSQADYLVLALPLTPQTKNIVCEKTLGLMKKDAYLINTARGGLVDQKALCSAVEQGKIAGASIDVFSQEPPLEKDMLKYSNIVLTPHISATSIETTSYVSRLVAEHIIEILVKGNLSLAVNYQDIIGTLAEKQI